MELACLVEAAFLHFEVLDARDLRALALYGLHGAGIVDLDTFLCCQDKVVLGSAHLAFLFKADNVHFLGTQALCSEGAVEAYAATAHDNDLLANLACVEAKGSLAQKFHGLYGLVGIGNGQAVFCGNTGSQDDGIVALFDFLHGDVHANLCVHAGTHAGLKHKAHFAVYHVPGQTEVRHAIAGNAAKHGIGLVDDHFVAKEGQVVGRGQAGKAAADDGDLLACGGQVLEKTGALLGECLGRALKGADVQSTVLLLPVAHVHAKMGAHAAGDAGEGVFGAQVAQGFREFALFNQAVHLLDAVADGTGVLAGRGAELLFQLGTEHHGSGDFAAISGGHDYTP